MLENLPPAHLERVTRRPVDPAAGGETRRAAAAFPGIGGPRPKRLISIHETSIDVEGLGMPFRQGLIPRVRPPFFFPVGRHHRNLHRQLPISEESIMEYRRLGASGLRVPALSFGTGTFGGKGDFFKAWGSTDTAGATRLVDVCLDHGVSMFDSADVYSDGVAEEILGAAIKGKRERVLISTKGTFPTGEGENDFGSSRQHLIDTVEKQLKRLGTDRIDLYQLHGQDYNTPVEETLATLD